LVLIIIINELGVLENMSGFVCPDCQECTHIFSRGGGEAMANEFGIKFLASVPIDAKLTQLIEEQGDVFANRFKKSILYGIFMDLIKDLNA
jgi:hypothetical protein